MTDPLRLVEDLDESDAQLRRVLESATSIAPPPGAKAQIWSVVSAKVGVTTTAAAAVKGVSAISIVKAVAAGTVLGLAATAGAVHLFVPAEPKPSSEHVVRVEPRPAASGGRPGARPADAPQLEAPSAPLNPPKPRPLDAAPPANELRAPSVLPALPIPEPRASQAAFPDDPPAARPASSNVDSARRESQLVAEARGLLRVGRADAALNVLGELERALPNGVLVQEREALLVQALRSSGRPEAARERAREFLRKYPSSPHAAAVNRALE